MVETKNARSRLILQVRLFASRRLSRLN